MGTDCDIYLPASARVENIAEVVGILVGFKPEKSELGNGYWGVRVIGSNVRVSLPEMCVIDLDTNQFDAQMCYVHLEPSRRGRKSMAGYKLVSSRSRPVWLAIGKRLVDFFGGFVVYKDTDNRICYRAPDHKDNDAEDGKEWQGLQERIFNLEPLTSAEVAKMKKAAAYDA